MRLDDDPTVNGADLTRLGDMVIIWIINNLASFIATTMKDNKQSQLIQHSDTQYQHPEHIVSQDYDVRSDGGQQFAVPNAVGDRLAKTQLPDLAVALDMAAGVSTGLRLIDSNSDSQHHTLPDPDPNCSL